MKYLFVFVLAVALAHSATAGDADDKSVKSKSSSLPNLFSPIADGCMALGGGISFVSDIVTPNFVKAVTDQLGIVGVIIRYALLPVLALLWPIVYCLQWVLYLLGLSKECPNEYMLTIR